MHNPFKKLKKVKVKKKPAVPVQPEKPKEQPQTKVVDEETAFTMAMSGVEPLKGSGREVIIKKETATTAPLLDEELEAALQFKKFMKGEVEFELEYTDEYMQGSVRGLDSKIFRQLKAGSYSVEAHLDLHGMNMEQAYDSVLFFIREAYLTGMRTVQLIPGRGKGSPMGFGVLKQELQHWLTRDPLKRIVLAFCTSLPRHGGAGALYVLLRKQKKQGGKVQFDRSGFWGDDK